MAGLRISCSPEEVQEIFRRLRHVFHAGNLSKPYPTKNDSINHYYLQIYTYQQDALLDQLEAANKDLEELAIENDRLLQTISELRQRLGEEPQPRPWDAVLGGKGK